MKETSETLAQWVERDLTEAARAGQLAPAFRCDDKVSAIADLMASGRHPILTGEPGVGKSALIYEVVRRAVSGDSRFPLAGQRVLQISLKNRSATLSKPDHQMGVEFQKLVRALADSAPDVVPFFRDIHIAKEFDLEAPLAQLAMRFNGPILAEGHGNRVRAMFEEEPGLDEHFITVNVAEPSMEEMRMLLKEWATGGACPAGFADTALETALELSQRFLTRSQQPRKAIELLLQTRAVSRGRIDAADVIARFRETFRVPGVLVDPDVPFHPDEMAASLAEEVVEQKEAVNAVVRMMTMVRSGLSDSRRPFGAFLFVGPTGVGKTHMAQLLAEHFFGSRERLLRLNMADYPGPEGASQLFGVPGSYSPTLRRGQLTLKLQGHPFAVLLLDEFEKAHPIVHDRFLQLVDEGVFTNGNGETVSCRAMVIIATSNAGAEVYRANAFGFARACGALEREVELRVQQQFRFEFLNRFDQVVHFRPLTRAGVRAIAMREIRAIGSRSGMRSRGLNLTADDGVLDWVTDHGYDSRHGARFLRRTIERHVVTAVAERLLKPVGRAREIRLVMDGQIVRAVPA
jgi:ATP-dependent Clp protease ATP-binding subunit ClpA